MRTIDELLLTFLLNAIWQIALAASAAAVCARLLRGAPARYRHMVWVAALSLAIFLPLLSSAQLFTPDIPGPSSPVKPAAEEINLSPAVLAPLPVRTAAAVKTTGLTLAVGPGLAAALIAAYFLFVLYRGGRLLKAYLRTRAMAGSAYDVPLPENIETALEKCKAVIGVDNVSVLFSGTLPVPVTTGTRRPLVILPEAFLRETDTDLLVTAIGHELVHIRRRDYLSNLVFELFYLPISFHPAAVFMKRRIDQSREICCDEIVAAQLLKAEDYARSLVTIAGSAANSGRLSPAITVGITDAGNLEVRIMSLLKKSEISSYKKSFLIIAAIVLLAVPCVVAAFFVPGVGINSASAHQRQEIKPEPTPPTSEEATKIDEQREKLKTALKEVEQSDLDPREKELRTEKLKEEFRSLQVSAEKLNAPAAEDERKIVEEKMQGLRESDRGLEDRKVQVEKLQRELETVAAGADTDDKKARLDELRMKLLATQGNLEATREDLLKRDLDMKGKMEMERLAREATVRMDDAARIATGREPGKVIENGIERNTDGEVVYKFVVRNDDGNKSVVIVSGRDGRVIKTEKLQ